MQKIKNSQNRFLNLFLLTIAILLIATSLQITFAADQTVDKNANPSGTVQNNISAAIEKTSDGDTITINPGTYKGLGYNTDLSIDKSLTFQGNGPKESVIIDAEKTAEYSI